MIINGNNSNKSNGILLLVMVEQVNSNMNAKLELSVLKIF